MFDTLFSLEHTIASSILEGESLPYMALCRIEGFIRELIPSLGDEYEITDDGIAIHKSAVISPSAVLLPPLIISEGAELRTGAFIRGSVIIGRGAVVGNSVEVKNSILFDEVEVPHLSYIGDSILGYRAHMGAGSITSNVKSDKTLVTVAAEGELTPYVPVQSVFATGVTAAQDKTGITVNSGENTTFDFRNAVILYTHSLAGEMAEWPKAQVC